MAWCLFESAHELNLYHVFRNYNSKITTTFPRNQWVNLDLCNSISWPVSIWLAFWLNYNLIRFLGVISIGPINSLAPGRSECDSKNVIFSLVLLIGVFRSSHDNAFWWMPQDLADDKSTLVQVMAWCRQATSHDLSQCWLSSLSPYGVARPQWVKCTKF